MAEYIEKAAAVAITDYAEDEHPYDKDPQRPDTYSAYNEGWSDACDYIRGHLEGEPVAKVATVREGAWINREYGTMVCSFCHTVEKQSNRARLHFCPTCGAKMDA